MPASTQDLERYLDRARAGPLTYEAVGATRRAELPGGFRHDRHELRLGDAVGFERAKEGLSRWQAQVGMGAKVFPDIKIADGETVLVVLGFGPLQVIAPCRIVYVIDETDRFGFAYGTLPGHPECGEESFVVERDRAGSTVFRITAFSRPAGIVTRLGAPVTRRVQRHFTNRYLEALAKYVVEDAAG
jgi:uncharacterized protein (UPF0548 family)